MNNCEFVIENSMEPVGKMFSSPLSKRTGQNFSDSCRFLLTAAKNKIAVGLYRTARF